VRLLVLGATGQLGADLVERVAIEEIETVALTRKDLDVAELDAIPGVLARHEYDVLVNCTAYNDTARAESDPAAAFQVNARAPEALARAAREAGARFVHVSTDYVFDGRAQRPYRETDLPAPLSVYGASKLTGEALARAVHPAGTTVVRTAALFGRAGIRRGGNFVETILRNAAERDRLRVVDDTVVSPTATADLAVALLALVRADAEPGIYHGVNTGEASWYELARAIVEIEELDVEVEPVPSSTYPSPVRRPAYSVLDTARIGAVAGPLPHWREGLVRYLRARGGEGSRGPGGRR
jgi:dTDP-4-dehydrorhamnose reductase